MNDTAPIAPTAAPFAFPVRVYWEDTDAGGIVFYANYLKFFERARTEWLRALGFEQHKLRHSTGGMFVVYATEVRYLKPARLDDELSITVNLIHKARTGITLYQQAWRGADLLSQGEIRIAWVDATTMQPIRMPADLASAIPQPQA